MKNLSSSFLITINSKSNHYPISVGATVENPTDLIYLYENHENFSVLPTYFVVFGPMALISTSIFEQVAPYGIQVDPARVGRTSQSGTIYL